MNDYKELIEELRKCKYSAPNTAQYAADAIEHLVGYASKCEKECEDAEKYIEQLVRERDAAVEDLKSLAFCNKCKHNETTEGFNDICLYCREDDKWEWRGVRDE